MNLAQFYERVIQPAMDGVVLHPVLEQARQYEMSNGGPIIGRSRAATSPRRSGSFRKPRIRAMRTWIPGLHESTRRHAKG